MILKFDVANLLSDREDLMNLNISHLDLVKDGLEKASESLKRELAKVRTGRAHPSLLDRIRVDYYGVATPLAQMAQHARWARFADGADEVHQWRIAQRAIAAYKDHGTTRAATGDLPV